MDGRNCRFGRYDFNMDFLRNQNAFIRDERVVKYLSWIVAILGTIGWFLTGAGCSPPPYPVPAWERLTVAKEDSIATQCACVEELGEGSAAECIDDRIAVVSSSGYLLRCLGGFEVERDSELYDSLHCLADAEEAWAACVGDIACTERLEIGDAASAQCAADRRAALMECDLTDPRIRACEG